MSRKIVRCTDIVLEDLKLKTDGSEQTRETAKISQARSPRTDPLVGPKIFHCRGACSRCSVHYA